MIKTEQQQLPEKRHRKGGGAFDTLSRILRGVFKVVFGVNFVMENRPGIGVNPEEGLVGVKSMFEAYHTVPETDGLNGVIIGRKGDGQFRNTHLVELTADHTPELGISQGITTNGAVRLKVTRDGDDLSSDRRGVLVADAGSIVPGLAGTVVQLAGHGVAGGVVISHIENPGDNPNLSSLRRIAVFNDSIYMFNLPTSSAGLSTGAIWRDGDTLKVVT